MFNHITKVLWDNRADFTHMAGIAIGIYAICLAMVLLYAIFFTGV